MNFSEFIFILEMIGTAAFAVSGVVVARDRKMDIFGAVVLGCATAVGGGMVRDLILGITPPVMFRAPIYVAVAALTSLMTFVCLVRDSSIHRLLSGKPELSDAILNTADSAGLAAFVVVGCRTAFDYGHYDNLFLCAFVGVLTGIGGGVLRDIFAGQMPLIMRKRVYGLAAIIGAVVYCLFLRIGMNVLLSTILSLAATCLIRFLAIHYRWNLPSFR